MANSFYIPGRNAFLGGVIDWDTDTQKVTLVDSADYTRDLTNHDYYDDITGAGRVAVGTIANPAITAGCADGDNVTFSTVTGDASEYLIIWTDTAGGESADPLICCIDTASGLPVTPNGGDITVTWAGTSPYIFSLGATA